MCYRCVELLPLFRVIPTHTPSLLMLRHSRVVHSCVVHPFLRADLSTPALSTLAISAPPSQRTILLLFRNMLFSNRINIVTIPWNRIPNQIFTFSESDIGQVYFVINLYLSLCSKHAKNQYEKTRIYLHCVSKSSPFLFLWLLGQMLTDFYNI